ncbi:MAG: hypothetical protein PHF74_05575 [Dehalococcoidales bacterium]|nr:hypothetical protein [Dehalococcoidales bacterium]
MSRLQQYHIFSPIGGIKQNLPGILLNDVFAEESENMIYRDGMVQRMQGRGSLYTDTITDPILMLTQYRKRSGTKYLMAATKDNVYYRGAATWTDITGATAFTGDADDIWSFCHFNDTFVFTNGVDPIKKWTGSSNVVVLGGSPNVSKYLTEYYRYLILGNLTDYPSNIQWGRLGYLEDFTNGDTGEQVIDGEDHIRGFAKLGDYLLIFKERSIFRAFPIGGDLVFNIGRINDKIGASAGHSIVVANGVVYFFGGDNRFYACVGTNEAPEISQAIPDLCDSINPDKRELIYGTYQEGLNRIVWLVPTGTSTTCNEMFIYDLDTQAWSRAIMEASVLCPGGYIMQASRTWNEQADTWDTATGRWNDVTLLAGRTANIAGEYDGTVNTMWQTRQDKATNFTGKFISKPISFSNLPTYNRLLKVQLYFKNEYGGNVVNAYIKRDYSDTWESIGTCTLTGTGNELTFVLPCNITARTVTLKLESQYQFRFIGGIFHYISQGTR